MASTDTFAAARMVEIQEQYPDTTDIVIDTAPGLHAVDFLSKPDKLISFFDGKLFKWLKILASDTDNQKNIWKKIVKTGAHKILDGLAQVGGKGFLLSFCFFYDSLRWCLFLHARASS